MLPRYCPDMTYVLLLILCLLLQPPVIAVTTPLLEQSNLSENGEKCIAIIVRADFLFRLSFQTTDSKGQRVTVTIQHSSSFRRKRTLKLLFFKIANIVNSRKNYLSRFDLF